MARETILNIIHLGPGNIGTAFLRQLLAVKNKVEDDYQIKINLIAIFRSQKGLYNNIKLNQKLINLLRQNNQQLKSSWSDIDEKTIIDLITKQINPFVVIDTTASDNTGNILYHGLINKGYVILSNKKPLSSGVEIFKKLYKYHHRLFFETTVGADLPVIAMMKELIATGDRIINIQGCFSGTVGYIFSQLQNGELFSRAVIKAKSRGLTEPDPRDDLSGVDVARKALILKRMIDGKYLFNSIKIEPLFPKQLSKLSTDQFINKINVVDKKYQQMQKNAEQQNRTLRYVAEIKSNTINVKIKKVENGSDLAALKGTDNIVIIKTKRYFSNPLVIKGPGAGVGVTASGVLGDLLQIVRLVKGNNI